MNYDGLKVNMKNRLKFLQKIMFFVVNCFIGGIIKTLILGINLVKTYLTETMLERCWTDSEMPEHFTFNSISFNTTVLVL